MIKSVMIKSTSSFRIENQLKVSAHYFHDIVIVSVRVEQGFLCRHIADIIL